MDSCVDRGIDREPQFASAAKGVAEEARQVGSKRADQPISQRDLDAMRAALDRVIARYRARAASPDDLEDCRVVILARVWSKSVVRDLGDEGREGALMAWLNRCVKNELLNASRVRKRETGLRGDQWEATVLADDPWVAIESRMRIIKCLQELPVQHARLLWLAYAEGLSIAEIATHEGKSVEAIKKALARVRSTVRARWSQEEF